jgi:hypothetical protein
MMRPFPSLSDNLINTYYYLHYLHCHCLHCCGGHRLEPLTQTGPSTRNTPLISGRNPFHRPAPAHLTVFFTQTFVLPSFELLSNPAAGNVPRNRPTIHDRCVSPRG